MWPSGGYIMVFNKMPNCVTFNIGKMYDNEIVRNHFANLHVTLNLTSLEMRAEAVTLFQA